MLHECIGRLEVVDHLIRIRGTGSPKQLARRLGISERSLFEYLKFMKELGAPIKYSKNRQSYYYTEIGIFQIKFNKTDLNIQK